MTDLVGKIILGLGLYLFGFYSGMVYQGKNTKEEAIRGVGEEATQIIKKAGEATKNVMDAVEKNKNSSGQTEKTK